MALDHAAHVTLDYDVHCARIKPSILVILFCCFTRGNRIKVLTSRGSEQRRNGETKLMPQHQASRTSCISPSNAKNNEDLSQTETRIIRPSYKPTFLGLFCTQQHPTFVRNNTQHTNHHSYPTTLDSSRQKHASSDHHTNHRPKTEVRTESVVFTNG
eukprot:50914_1